MVIILSPRFQHICEYVGFQTRALILLIQKKRNWAGMMVQSLRTRLKTKKDRKELLLIRNSTVIEAGEKTQEVKALFCANLKT